MLAILQWFGDLVTARWWNDAWLNEGLSTYFEKLSFSDVYGLDGVKSHYFIFFLVNGDQF